MNRIKFDLSAKDVPSGLGISKERVDQFHVLFSRVEHNLKFDEEGKRRGDGHKVKFSSQVIVEKYSAIPDTIEEAMFVGYMAGRYIGDLADNCTEDFGGSKVFTSGEFPEFLRDILESRLSRHR